MGDHVPDRVSDAQIGDHVWVYDHEKRLYDAGKFLGRGEWRREKVASMTRVSFETASGKFSRKDGAQMSLGGWSAMYRAYGTLDRAEREILNKRHAMVKALEQCDDIATLLKVAELLGEPIPEALASPA
jgi:hypothetical protein